MSDNYVIEIRPQSAGITVQASIVVRDGRHFLFCAATHAFNTLNGELFDSPIAAESTALRHTLDRSMRSGFDSIDVGHRSEAKVSAH